MPKRFNPTQKVKEFVPKPNMKGDGGWTIAYSKEARRYDLRREGKLHFSHVAREACVRIAENVFEVEMKEG